MRGGRDGQPQVATLLVCALAGLLAASSVLAADGPLPPPPLAPKANGDAGRPDAPTVGALRSEDQDVASEMELLEDLELLQKLDAFDPGAKSPVR